MSGSFPVPAKPRLWYTRL